LKEEEKSRGTPFVSDHTIQFQEVLDGCPTLAMHQSDSALRAF
jgi:hypothetical protein